MPRSLDRRLFLKRAAQAAGGLAAAPFIAGCAARARRSRSDRVNCVMIGCGERAMIHLDWLASENKDNLAAIVDPDESRLAAVKRWLRRKNLDVDRVKTFTDYRRMFSRLDRELDAVLIATPNHQHAGPALIAMELGKGVFCEKPLCHDIGEARKLRRLAAESKAPTQMGNQGHCEDGYRRLCEFVAAGVVGHIRETHSWTDRANGGTGPRPHSSPVPHGLHWDEWIGPAPYRDYHAGLHPHDWHGWLDFGTGSLGNMGCHVLDGVYWALKVDHPSAIEAEEITGGTSEQWPTGAQIRFDIPAREQLPPLKVFWYEGFRTGAPTGSLGANQKVSRKSQNLPPLLIQLQEQYPDEEFDSNGTLYVGEKGILYTGTYGGKMRLVPFESMQALKQPPRTLPRPKNIMADFLDACREGRTETAAGFDYSSRLTEFTLLGNLALRAGMGRRIEWDGPGMKVTNLQELNEWVCPPRRRGWPG